MAQLFSAVVWGVIVVVGVPLYVAVIAAFAYIGKIMAIRALFKKTSAGVEAPPQGEVNNG